MTGFGALYFTDCRVGEGLLGGAGFQFRAASPDVEPRAMELVERGCLYEPPPQWMNEHRRVEDYPRSLAHVGDDGLFATASGRYLGTEVKAEREGNHFTHAIVTDDPTCFGQVRPAQLWGSRVWAERAGDGTTCPPVPAEPPTGPLGAEELQRWVATQPDGEAILVDVLSALERVRAGGLRVVMVAEDAEPVVSWLAAATLLMPRPEALRVGFKVFAVNPQYSAHDVVALHSDWAGPFRGAPSGLGFVVFDLVDGVRSAVEPTESAVFWASRFLQRDCFDVLDAVELSGVIRSGGGSRRAERTVAAALVLNEPVPDARVDEVLAWLERGVAGLSARRRDELFAIVLAAGPDAGQLRQLTRIAARTGDAAFRERIRWQVFGREVAALDGRSGDPTDAAAALRRLEAALADASPTSLAAFMGLATAYGLAPDPAGFREPLRAFARWWAGGGLDVEGVASWACYPEVVDLLRDELAHRIASAPAESAAALGELWWPRLWATIEDPRSELDAALAAAAMRRGDADVRAQVTEIVVDALHRTGAPDATDAAWRALFARSRPAVTDLLPVLRASSEAGGTPSAATVRAVAEVLLAERQPTTEVLDVLARLDELEVDPGRQPLPAWQREIVLLHATVAGLIEANRTMAEPVDVFGVARKLAAVSPAVLRAEAATTLDALVEGDPAAGVGIVLAIPPPQRAVLVAKLERVLPSRRDARAPVLAFALMLRLDEMDKAGAKRMREALSGCGRALDWATRNQVADRLEAEHQDRWWQICGERSMLARLNPFGRRAP
jgi:hypothetical protein